MGELLFDIYFNDELIGESILESKRHKFLEEYILKNDIGEFPQIRFDVSTKNIKKD